jgi:tetratricopeptide (TPR) repeat protein
MIFGYDETFGEKKYPGILRKFSAMTTWPYYALRNIFLRGKDPYCLAKLGDIYVELGMYKLAIRNFEKSLLYGAFGCVHMQLGHSFWQLGDRNSGLRHWRKGYETWKAPILGAQVAKMELELGHTEEAKKMYLEVKDKKEQLDECALAMLQEVESKLKTMGIDIDK